jgi:hypothetical protein
MLEDSEAAACSRPSGEIVGATGRIGSAMMRFAKLARVRLARLLLFPPACSCSRFTLSRLVAAPARGHVARSCDWNQFSASFAHPRVHRGGGCPRRIRAHGSRAQAGPCLPAKWHCAHDAAPWCAERDLCRHLLFGAGKGRPRQRRRVHFCPWPLRAISD